MLTSSGCLIRRPVAPSAVAVLPTDGTVDDARLSDALAANGVAVVCMPLSMDFAVGLQVAREEFGESLPLMVAASGSSVPGARRAAQRAGLSGAVLLNTPVGRSVGQRGLSTMVFVDKDLLVARIWSRLASRLGHASFHVVDGTLESPLNAWLTDPTHIVRDPLIAGSTVAALIASAALVAVPLVPATVSASAGAPASARVAAADPFAGGVSVGSLQIKGDAAARAPLPRADKDGQVPSTAIQGDGGVSAAGTGSISLTDVNGLVYYVNTDITFSTTSSASGAMSEASFSLAVPASTSAGGTSSSILSDAFDGYNNLFVDVAGTTLGTDTNAYNQTGAGPTFDAACADRQVIFPVLAMQGLDVQRLVYVPSDDSFARWLNTFTNPTASPITVGVGTHSDLGSDSSTVITGSSNADTTADLTDTWIGTFEDWTIGGTSTDPRLAHVIQGAGAPVAPTAINFVDGSDNPYWAWDITVQPGETITIMNFVTGDYTKARAAAKAAELAALTPAGDGTVNGLRCMTEAQVNSIRNFAMPEVSVASVTVNETAGVATLTFTRATSGAAATATFTVTAGTATLGADYSDPASFTVSFAAGASTAQVTVPIVNDTLIEGDETIQVAITGVTGYGGISVTGATATITIVSDDVAPTTTETPTTLAPTTLAPTTLAPTTLPTPIAEPVLPATGRSSGALGWLAALFAGAGATMIGLTRRRRTGP